MDACLQDLMATLFFCRQLAIATITQVVELGLMVAIGAVISLQVFRQVQGCCF